MNLPKKIKFGHRTIDVRYDSELSPARSLLSTGHTDLGYIKVQTSLPTDVQAECIFRGVIHAILDKCGLTHDAKDKTRIGTGLLCVIRDNPSLLSPIMPEKVRIFGQNWAVIQEPEHYDLAGRKENLDNTLHINSAYRGQLGWSILWHEMLHAIWDKMLFEICDDVDERDVEILSFCLCTLFTQNDFSWVLEDEKNNN